MAEFKLGRIRFVWKNDWQDSTVYYQDDVVAFGGKIYICVIGHTSQTDFFSDLDIVPPKWNLVSDGQTWRGEWTTSTEYIYNDIVKYGARLYIANTVHTSAATIELGLEADQSKWTSFAEGLDWQGDWSVNTSYKANDFVKYGGSTYVCNENHTSAATVELGLEADQSKWDYFNQGLEYKSNWESSVRYKANDIVKYGAGVWICVSAHTSGATFGSDGVYWERFVEGFQYENDWSPFKGYQPGDVVRYGGNQYIAIDNSTNSVPTQTPAEWDLFTEGFRFIGDWNEDSANQHYKVGEIVRLGGYTYICTQDHNTAQQPPNAAYWKLVNEGFRWRGEWLDDQEYFEGDVTRYGNNSYVCIKYHISEGDDYSTETLVQPGGGAQGSRPDLTDSGQYWSILAIGTEQSVLTTTGDLVYFGDNAPKRLPIGKNGQVLRVDENNLPNWEFLQSIEDVYHVAEHGEDLPWPEYGGNIDRPWKSIRYATEQLEKGPKYSDAQYMLELNRVFIQEEVGSFINYQIANATPGSIYENFTYGEDKCKRDVGIILDKIKWDLGHGGNLKTRSATQSLLGLLGDGPHSIASEQEGSGYYPGLGDEADVSIAAYNYMLTLIDAVLKNESPATIYQNVTDDSTAIVEQYTNELLEVEAGAYTRLAELVGIVTTAIASQDATDIPERVVPQTLIKVSTGKYYETLPIIVPAYCAILGDELRSTQIIASEATTPTTDTPNTVATFDRIVDVVSDIVVGNSVTSTTGNIEQQSAEWPFAIAEQSNLVENLVLSMKYQIDYKLNRFSSGYFTDPVGYNTTYLSGYGDARDNIERNIDFVIAEAMAFLNEEYSTLKYSKTSTKRDLRYIVDAILYDLTHGGNSLSVITGLAYYDGDDDSKPQLDSTVKTPIINTYNFLKTTMQSVAANTPIVDFKQSEFTQVVQGNGGNITLIADNIEDIIEIIDTGPAAVGTTVTLVNPTLADGVNSTTALIAAFNALDTATSGIQTDTISYIDTTYPDLTYNSAKCSRDVGLILEAVSYDFALNSNYRTLKAAHAYLRDSASEVYTLNQKTITRDAIQYALLDATDGAIANVSSDADAIARITASAKIIDAIIFSASNEGSVCQSNDQNVYYAMLQLERNREFIKAEISSWIADQIQNATAGSIWDGYTYNSDLCMRDVDLYIDALKYDLKYPGNYSSRYVARYYANSVVGSQEEDMFYLRDATGVRNCTLNGLNGDLTPENAFGTSRTTAGAYCSLDPGFGPDDFKAWIITRSPYIQGVTTFGYAAIGQKIDGALHNGGNDSMVSNDFTQVISDGIGAWITNNGRAELVSVFTYYSHIGYLAEAGGRVRATNGNNSYGDFGSVAEGVDPDETPITAIVDNSTQYSATISQVNTDANQLFNIELGHAGNDYTEAAIDIFGVGADEEIFADEFRDGAVSYAKVNQNVDPDIPIGGSGYTIVSNVAQEGTTSQITLSATDGNLSTAYPGMKIYIIGGAAIGQYGIIDTYDAGTKIATVIKESDGTSGWDHVVPGTTIVAPNSSSTYQIEPAVSIADSPKADAQETGQTGTWTELEYFETSAQYTGVSTTTSGSGTGATFDVTRNGSKYYLTINAAGTGYSRLDELTIAGTDVGGESPANDITVTVISLNSVTGAIVEIDFVGLAEKGLFIAFGASGATQNSIDGATWTSGSSTGFTTNVTGVASGLIDDGSSTFKQSTIVAVSPTQANAVRYSTDGITWNDPGAIANWNIISSSAKVAFGQINSTIGRFLIIDSDSRHTWYSDDGGANWIQNTNTFGSTGYNCLTYGKGLFVALRSGSTNISWSANGVDWFAGTNLPSGNWTDVIWGNGRFVAIDVSGTTAAISLDGKDWALTSTITVDAPGSDTPRRISYGQGIFVVTTTNTQSISYSEDGIAWTARTLVDNTTSGYNAITFGNPSNTGVFVSTESGNSANVLNANIGSRARGRASVANEQVFEIRLIEPGSGYTTVPAITIVDPNNIDDVDLVLQLADGAIANPTFINRGTGFTTASAEVDAQNSNGNATFPQDGSFIAVRRLSERPVNGSNIEFASLPGEFYKLVNVVSFLGTNDGSYTGFLQVSPQIKVTDSLPDKDPVELRIRFSQVRLTGHDFLDIGTGNFTKTNYPNTPTQLPIQVNETVDNNGGRVFFTATDQDGNFRVGDLFSIEQSTGVATLNADAFNIAGLQELSLGEVTLGGNSATVTEFSTDPFFTANSDNIIPTQRAIKAYIEAQIGGGGASLNVNSITAGDIFIGANTITTVSGLPINIKANVVFSGTVLGTPLAYNYFLR